MEYGGILNRMEARQSRRLPIRWCRSGRLNDYEIVLAANGAGWQRAAAAVDAGWAVSRPEAVISTGFCGALDPKLQIADVVVGTRVVAGGSDYAALPVGKRPPKSERSTNWAIRPSKWKPGAWPRGPERWVRVFFAFAL